jgi:hypothetical protein
MKHRNTLLLLLAAIGVVGAADPATQPARKDSVPQPEATQMAQQFSPKCATSYGVCWVPPQPVNSVCYCGNDQGVIVP